MNVTRFANKNIIEALDNYSSYEIHQKKLKDIKSDLEEKKVNKLKVLDERREMLKMRIINNKLKNHEF